MAKPKAKAVKVQAATASAGAAKASKGQAQEAQVESTQPGAASPLELLLESGDVDAVKAFFRGMPEKQRLSHSAQVAAWCRQVHTKEIITTPRGEFSNRALFISSRTALMCAGSYSELAKVKRWNVPHGDEAYELLMDRRPEWLDKWAAHLLAGDRFWLDWLFVRRLVREGLIPKPDHPNYALGMIQGMVCWEPGRRPTVRQRLEEDPALLDDEIWGIFEHEGAGENSLANVDRFGNDDWAHTLADYAKAGKLDRARLLSICIEALQRDYNHYRAKWFSAFYDLLQPSAAEDRGNAQAFLSLLGVTAPNIVGWAFKKVQAQVKAGSYSAEELVAGLRPALEARSKGLVISALKLLAQTASHAPELQTETAQTALVALGHADGEAQAAALGVIEACANREGAPPDLVDAIDLGSHAEMVLPSLRARLEALLGDRGTSSQGTSSQGTSAQRASAARVRTEPAQSSSTLDLSAALDLSAVPLSLQRLFAIPELLQQPSGAGWVLPAARFDGTELPRLAHRAAILPITDLEELIDVAARVIEDAVGPDEVERVLDAIARLADQRPPDFERRTAPLMKRVEQLFRRNLAPFVGDGPAADVSGLVHAWVSQSTATFRVQKGKTKHSVDALLVSLGDLELRSYTNDQHIMGVLSRRVYQLSLRVAKSDAHQLLSAPTHAGGLIAPQVLAARANAHTGAPPQTLDVAVALLRLAPENREEALRVLESGPSGSTGARSKPRAADASAQAEEWYQAIRYALSPSSQAAGKVPVAKVAKNVALWAAAARARAPWGADEQVGKAFPKAGPDVGEPATYEVSFSTNKYKHVSIVFPDGAAPRGINPDCIPAVWHTKRSKAMLDRHPLTSATDVAVRWAATLWPIARESYYAAAFTEILNNINWWEARWVSKTLLEPLLDPGTPLRDMGLLLLTTALGAKEPGEYGLATDAAISAIADGRLGSDNFGRGLSVLLGSGAIKPPRWAKTLGDVSRASDAHAAVVKLALEACLPALAEPPRDFAKLLELLHELCVQFGHGVSTSTGRAYLESVKGSNKVAKLAKALLALPSEGSPALTLATKNLAEMRIDAAQRWVAE